MRRHWTDSLTVFVVVAFVAVYTFAEVVSRIVRLWWRP